MPRALTAAALIALASAGAAVPVHGATLEAASIDNAALLYLRTAETYDRSGINDLYDQMAADAAAVAPGSDGAKKLIRSQDAVNLLLRAAAMDECDFEIDYAEGFDTLLPHLGQIRAMSKLLAADARRLELAGDVSGSVARTAALYRMAGHITRNGVLINSLVGIAIANVGHKQAERLAKLELEDADRQALLAAIDSLSSYDPYDVIDAIKMEQEILRTWVTQRFSGENAAADFYEMMTPMANEGAADDEARATFASMDEEAFRTAVEKAASSYDVVLDALYADDMNERLAKLEKRVEAGDYGPVAMIVIPSFAKVAESAQRAKVDLASVREQIAPKDDE